MRGGVPAVNGDSAAGDSAAARFRSVIEPLYCGASTHSVCVYAAGGKNTPALICELANDAAQAVAVGDRIMTFLELNHEH